MNAAENIDISSFTKILLCSSFQMSENALISNPMQNTKMD